MCRVKIIALRSIVHCEVQCSDLCHTVECSSAPPPPSSCRHPPAGGWRAAIFSSLWSSRLSTPGQERVHSVHFTLESLSGWGQVCIVHCVLCSVHLASSVQCSLSYFQCPRTRVQCLIFSVVPCSVCSEQCTVYSVQCSV